MQSHSVYSHRMLHDFCLVILKSPKIELSSTKSTQQCMNFSSYFLLFFSLLFFSFPLSLPLLSFHRSYMTSRLILRISDHLPYLFCYLLFSYYSYHYLLSFFHKPTNSTNTWVASSIVSLPLLNSYGCPGDSGDSLGLGGITITG